MKKKREGYAAPYGTDLLLEPYGFATIQVFYNVNHKNQLPYGSGLLRHIFQLPYGNASVSSSRAGQTPKMVPLCSQI